jgi:hypothetical protein
MVRIPTAPNAITSGDEKALQNGSFTRRSIRGRYFSGQAMTNNNAARKKVLQITTFMAARSMRAVLYSAYQVHSPLS